MKMLIKAMVVFISMLLVESCDNSTESKKDDIEPDSTTQNFTFEEYEFGDGGNSSYFNDVWVFDQNNIWAVGEVYHDPVIGGTNEYNIVQWNGNKWIGRGRGFNSAGIYGIWPIDSSHIYFAVGIVLEYKNGEFNWMDFSQLIFSQGQSVEHLWGSSESNIWGVGPWGTIVHYDGSKWTKLDAEYRMHFQEVTGSKTTGVAYAAAIALDNGNSRLYRLNGGTAELIFELPPFEIGNWIYDVRQLNDKELLLINGDVYKYNIETKERTKIIDIEDGGSIYQAAIYAWNDIYYFGHTYEGESFLIHYNGKRYKQMDLPFRDGGHMNGSFAIKDLAVEAEFSLNKAYLLKVKRVAN